MIGVISGAFKPFTNGHYFLTVMASLENEEVHLFVSIKDRKRKGEIPLCFKPQMKFVWDKYFIEIMPRNVIIHFVSNPTSAVYDLLADADENKASSKFKLYGDEKDLDLVFPCWKLQKYNPFLYENALIEKRSFVRKKNVDISGTKMREYLGEGNILGFTNGLPQPVQQHGQKIFDILRPIGCI